MSMSIHEPARDARDDPVDRAVAAVLAEPVPRAALGRVIEAASGWDATPPSRSHPRRWPIVFAGAAAAVLAVAAYVGVYLWRSGGHPPHPATPGPVATSPDAGPQPVVRRRTHTFFQPQPITHPVVSDGATVFVTTGPQQPVRWGEELPHDKIRAGTGVDVGRVHVWDWSKSAISRVVAWGGTRHHLWSAAVSPDGRTLLTATGEAVDLATGRVERHAGFEVGKDQRAERVRFAPDGRRVAALISRSKEGRPAGRSIRVIDLRAGKRLAEFPADDVDWSAWVAFPPDGASVVHASPDNVVTRRDLRTGDVLVRYLPALEPHGAVGVAASPDGRYVAAGHYRGELFAWDAASGKQILHHRFQRPNGEPDTFWQAKVLAFSPDGERLSTAAGDRLQVVETRTGKVAARADEPLPADVRHLRWSADGQAVTIVVASSVVMGGIDAGWPPRGEADVLPRVFGWRWKTGKPPERVVVEEGVAAGAPLRHSGGDAPGPATRLAPADKGAAAADDARYETRDVHGWTVRVSRRLLDERKDETDRMLKLVGEQLAKVVDLVPAPAVVELRKVPLWVSPEYPNVRPTAEYHPDAGWLRANGRDPAMAKGVEFTDVRGFEREVARMPVVVLHELAHAYHDRVLGFDHPEVIACYRRAKADKRYDAVERSRGPGRPVTKERAYAMTDEKEYFAECTEAFFGRNDYFPFTRDELERHDPDMFRLLGRLWSGPLSKDGRK